MVDSPYQLVQGFSKINSTTNNLRVFSQPIAEDTHANASPGGISNCLTVSIGSSVGEAIQTGLPHKDLALLSVKYWLFSRHSYGL